MDFLVECIVREAEPKPQEVGNPGLDPNLPAWTLHIDGSSKPEGSGVGLVLTVPDDIIAEYTLWFKFSATNNEVKYKALVMGLRIAIELRVRRLKVFTDS